MSAVTVPAPAVKNSARSRRDRMLVVAVIVVAAVGFYVMAWKPQSASLGLAHEDVASLEAQLAAVPAPIVAGPGADAEAVAAEAAAAKMLLAVPAHINTPDVLRQLDALAALTGVKLGSITLSQPVPLVAGPAVALPTGATTAATGPVSLTLVIGVTGDPAASAAFVAGLTTLPRLVVVDQVTTQSTPADEATQMPASHELQVTLKVFATGP